MHKELYFLPTINMKKIITFISMSDPKYVILVIADLQTKDLIGRENLVLTTQKDSPCISTCPLCLRKLWRVQAVTQEMIRHSFQLEKAIVIISLYGDAAAWHGIETCVAATLSDQRREVRVMR